MPPVQYDPRSPVYRAYPGTAPGVYETEDVAQAQFIQKVLGAFGTSMLMAAAGVWGAWSLPPQMYGAIFILYIILALAATFGSRSALAPLLLYAFAAVSGAITAPLVHYVALRGGAATVFDAFAASGLIFCGMGMYGLTTRRNLAGWGTFLFMGLIGAMIAGLIGMFVTHTPVFELLWSGAIVVVFTGLTAYDLNQIKLNWRSYSVSQAALQLYLDFLNLFVAILRIVAMFSGNGGGSDRRDW